jgi:HSP20 family protein
MKEDDMTNDRNTMQKGDARAVERVAAGPTTLPAVDIYESADEVTISADLPGVKQDGLLVEIIDDELLFRAARPARDGNDPWAATYERTFRLPPGVDAEKVVAKLQDGVLTLNLPKPARLKPRKIDVRAA